MSNRQQLRQAIRAKRRALTQAEQQSASTQLAQHLSQNPIFLNSQRIAVYITNENEIDPLPLLQLAWQQNKTCYLPVLNPQSKNELSFIIHTADDKLILNLYKIPEPQFNLDKIIAPQQLDLVLVPLVAFDAHGNRLGMGAGYYDRTFAFLQKKQRPTKPFLLGLAYEWQKLEEIINEEWDIKLDAIATEKGIITCATG
jgi:5-formyltetrahydrofolate cyclo-ligase